MSSADCGRLWGEALDDTLLTCEQLQAMVGLSRSGIYSMVRCGNLPEPMRIGRRSYWAKSSIKSAMLRIKERSMKSLGRRKVHL
ncbi:MAG: AlpA family phage regulatory protein [Duodenibacillus sp.]|nr:AlpA family phage regulatory protein [Duodenibacillus sp.]